MPRYGKLVVLALTVALLVFGIVNSEAHSPDPKAKKKFIEEGTWERVVDNIRAFDSANRANPEFQQWLSDRRAERQSMIQSLAPDTVRTLVILVDFPDYSYDSTTYDTGTVQVLNSSVAATPASFDSLLFSIQGVDPVFNETGSMTEFYIENSNGNYVLEGDVVGWYEMPDPYWRYVGVNDGLGGGGNALAGDAVDAAEAAGVDFSAYANNALQVPGIIVVHAGPGAETGAYGIWSHRSNIAGGRNYDGVLISGYTMQPEEQYSQVTNMGVFCHEWGHVLGLPDLYDIDYNPGSEGVGSWSLMAGGSWNNGGRSPSCFDAWCRIILGFTPITWIESNQDDVQIPAVETGGPVFGFRTTPGVTTPEYWLIENRQPVGQFDSALPGHGLMIYHVDETMPDNTVPGHYHVAVEQADGQDHLGFSGSNGDLGDPWPGSTGNRHFHDYTTPSARVYDGDTSGVGIWNISDSDSIMTADLEIVYGHPWVVLVEDSMSVTDPAPGGNNNGTPEPGETVLFNIEVGNLMANAYNADLTLTTTNPYVTIVNPNVGFEGAGTISPITGTATLDEPIQIQIPSEFATQAVNLTATIHARDEVLGGEHMYFVFEYSTYFGHTNILVVDDDNGRDYEGELVDGFARIGVPVDVWDKSTQSTPGLADMTDYGAVFWMNGADQAGYYGVLSSADVTVMSQYLDNGGNLCLASITAPTQLHALDSAFMANYLHAYYAGTALETNYRGVVGNEVSDGVDFTVAPLLFNYNHYLIESTNGGMDAFTLSNGQNTTQYGNIGVTYSSPSYKTAFFGFPLEMLDDEAIGRGFEPKDTLLTRLLDFFGQGTATPVYDRPEQTLPASFTLSQNYPNPFNPTTTIEYTISQAGHERISLEIFNVIGQRVTTLVDKVEGPGTYQVDWDGTASAGGSVASGIYFYRLVRGDESVTRKMVLLK